MLNKLSKFCPSLLLCSSRHFGSSHGAPVKVDINKQATWIKFKTSRKLQSVDGVKDTHIPLPDLITIDPIQVTRDAPWYDIDKFFYGSDLFHHDKDHELHTTGPQGYAVVDDPHEGRSDMILPGMLSASIIFFVFVVREYADIDATKALPELIVEAQDMENQADKRLKAKADRIRELTGESAGSE